MLADFLETFHEPAGAFERANACLTRWWASGTVSPPSMRTHIRNSSTLKRRYQPEVSCPAVDTKLMHKLLDELADGLSFLDQATQTVEVVRVRTMC